MIRHVDLDVLKRSKSLHLFKINSQRQIYYLVLIGAKKKHAYVYDGRTWKRFKKDKKGVYNLEENTVRQTSIQLVAL